MEDLTGKRISFKTNSITSTPLLVCKPLDNEFTEDEFINLEINMTNRHVLVGKVTYSCNDYLEVEIEELGLHTELDPDLFTITVL